MTHAAVSTSTSSQTHRATRQQTTASSEEDYYQWDEEERGEAVRPFRLWDAVNKCNLRWRNYADKKRAHVAALIEARWLPIGATIEVYDCRTGKLLGQYTRRVDSIRFSE